VTLDQWRARYEELGAETAQLRGERDAARAETADYRTQAGRAQEALRHLMNGLPCDDVKGAAYEHTGSAWFWLADQLKRAAEPWKAEAARAVEALKQADAEISSLAVQCQHRTNETWTWVDAATHCLDKAAALGAGAAALEAVDAVKSALRQIIANRQGDIGACTYACGPDRCECSECLASEALTRLEAMSPKSTSETSGNPNKTEGAGMAGALEETHGTN